MSHAHSTQRDSGSRLRAGLAAPMILPAFFFARAFILDYKVLGVSDGGSLPIFLGILSGLYMYSLVGFVVIGLPTIAILSFIGRLRIWTLMVAGTVEGTLLGCCEYYVYLAIQGAHGNYSSQPDFDFYRLLGEAVFWGLLGLLTAAIYGIVAKIRFQ